MHPTTAESNLRRPEQDMTKPVEIQTTSLLLAALYQYLGFGPPYRIEKFVRNESATLYFKDVESGT